MKSEILDLHGCNRREALDKLRSSLAWCLDHGVAVLVVNHGRGLHSEHGLSVVKQELRRALKEDPQLSGMIREQGYRVVYGESEWPVALAYNEGQTLIVAKGLESEPMGSSRQHEKNQRIYSDEGREQRRWDKKQRQQKSSRRRLPG